MTLFVTQKQTLYRRLRAITGVMKGARRRPRAQKPRPSVEAPRQLVRFFERRRCQPRHVGDVVQWGTLIDHLSVFGKGIGLGVTHLTATVELATRGCWESRWGRRRTAGSDPLPGGGCW